MKDYLKVEDLNLEENVEHRLAAEFGFGYHRVLYAVVNFASSKQFFQVESYGEVVMTTQDIQEAVRAYNNIRPAF